MTSTKFNTEIKITSQHLYDSLMSLLLDTISSRDYLDNYEITVNDIQRTIKWYKYNDVNPNGVSFIARHLIVDCYAKWNNKHVIV